MKFKQNKGSIVVIGPKSQENLPLPKVGKVYPCYDDGKTSLSRLEFYQIEKIAKIEELPEEIQERIAEEVKNCYWLFRDEQTDIPVGKFVYRDLYKEGIDKTSYFLRTEDGGWFAIGMWFGAGRLDITGQYTKEVFANETYGIPEEFWERELDKWEPEALEVVKEFCDL